MVILTSYSLGTRPCYQSKPKKIRYGEGELHSLHGESGDAFGWDLIDGFSSQ